MRKYDGGGFTVVERHRTWEQASAKAGRMRDGMTDAECALDYNYQAVHL